MKKILIRSGEYDLGARMQFQVQCELHLRESWLEQELRLQLAKEHNLLSRTIEVKKIDTSRQWYFYRVTFAPLARENVAPVELGIDEILAALESIEAAVREARRTQHFLNGLVESFKVTPQPPAPKPGSIA